MYPLVTINNLEALGRSIAVPVGQKLLVVEGDTVRVHMTVDYLGPAIDGTVWTAIGWDTGFPLGFIEAYNNGIPVHFDESFDFVTYLIESDVPIPGILMPIEFGLYGQVLDMYAKIMEVPGPDIFTPTYPKVIEVMREPKFQNFGIVSYDKL